MKHLGCVLLLFVGACLMSQPKQDGASCSQAADCDSNNCKGNICIGSECGGGSCPTNFACYHSDGDPVFGIGGGDRCEPICDANRMCPAQWKCNPGATYCEYVGPTVTVSVSNMQPTEHEVVTFTGTIDPPINDVMWKWDFGTLGTKTGPTAQMTFPLGDTPWSVTATTPAQNGHYENGTIRACATVGDACTPYAGDCCGMLSCNPSTAHCE